MAKKPTYKHPNFVIGTDDNKVGNKRYWLSLKISEVKKEKIIIILKNPSRGTKDISDKTLFTVTNYIFKNRDRFEDLQNIGEIIILNLFPFYETDSSKLFGMNKSMIDAENIDIINNFCKTNQKVIIAWGNHPYGLYNEFEELKKTVLLILSNNNNRIFYVDKFSNHGNPKHGQVWGYANDLKLFCERNLLKEK